MVSNETLLHLSGGYILSQAIIINALHEAKVIDKKIIIEKLQSWVEEAQKLDNDFPDAIKPLELLASILSDDNPTPRPDWFRGVLSGGKN